MEMVQPSSLKDQAYEILKNAIINGEFENNEMITEQIVYEKFNISRTPYREATQTLAANGWVYSIPYKGIYVKPITLDDVKEVFQMRFIIEPQIAKVIQSHSRDRCISLLNEALRNMKTDSNEQSDFEFMSLDHDFHKIFYEQTNNSRIKNISEQLSDTMLRLGVKFGNRTRRKDVILEHKEIIKALENGDVEKTVIKHLDNAFESFLNRDEI